MATQSKRVVLFTDSRGLNMAIPLNEQASKVDLNVDIRVEKLGGATIEKMLPIAEKYLSETPVDQAYFFIGVNNLTEKHVNRKVTGLFTDPTDLVEIMEQKLDIIMKTLQKLVPKLIICHVIGLDINVYNKTIGNTDTVGMQTVINEGLPLLNAAIDSINMNANVKGPWLTDTIHSLIMAREYTNTIDYLMVYTRIMKLVNSGQKKLLKP